MKKSLILVSVATVIAVIYFTGCSKNELPVIDTFSVQPESDSLVTAGDTVQILCEMSDPDGDLVFYEVTADDGVMIADQDNLSWASPDHSGSYTLTCTASDYEGDSTRDVTQNLTIDVQNYFPMSIDSWWKYEAPGIGGVITLDVEVRSYEILGNNEFKWNLKRTFTFPDIPTIVDSFSYFNVKGDSVWYYDPSLTIGIEYLAFHLPLWLGKTWDVEDGEGGSGTVSDIKDRGTEAGNFYDCMQIDLNAKGEERTLWLAPDVGIIVNRVSVPTGLLDFELVDYGVD
jgi:hypothetical protein